MRGREPTSFCIVDDDEEFVEFLKKYLEAKGWTAATYSSGEALLKDKSLTDFDFFVVDLGLPGIDGVDLVTLIRAQSDAGILIVSGRMGPDAFNSALSAGADMFVNKPVRFDQIYHAIMSVCRRLPNNVRPAAPWQLNPAEGSLTSPEGNAVTLSAMETKLIVRLAESAPDAVSREELAIYGGVGSPPDYRNLDAAIFRLRRKIERETAQPSPFRTVHGKGYQLSAKLAVGENRKENQD